MIIAPLCGVALAGAALRYQTAEQTSETLSDQMLLAVALVVSRDVVLSEGDLLTEELLESLTSALGDQVFYHVRGPSNDFITGYANPPPLPGGAAAKPGAPVFFDSLHNDRRMRVMSLREFISEPSIGGWVTVTVWQTTRRREALSLQLAMHGVALMCGLIVAAGLMVWFGVRWGLRPLTDLREAVARRSPDDLTPIRRPIPREARSLVRAMNQLFERLRRAFDERDAIVSNAAHQLRNPIAAIQAQAEAAAQAADEVSLRERVLVVAEAARRASRLTRQLLSMEKATGRRDAAFEPVDLVELARGVTNARAPEALRAGVELSFAVRGAPQPIAGDPVLLAEAIENLIDNALRYGGGAPIRVIVGFGPERAQVVVEDDGPGVPEDLRDAIFQRFRRGVEDGGDGCGLGLAIVREVAAVHGGAASCESRPSGARFTLALRHLGRTLDQARPLAAE